jgi:hypothetical protein
LSSIFPVRFQYFLGRFSPPSRGISHPVLFLEAGATPLRFLISCRRILYLKTILKRPQHELIRRVYDTQQADTLPGDFYQLVQDDFALLGKQFNDD